MGLVWARAGLLVLAAGTPLAAAADDAQVARTRVALITLVVDPAAFKAAPEPVRCPMFGGTLDGVNCAAVNAGGETVGSVYLTTSKLPPAQRREVLDRCAAQKAVKPECVAEVNVEIGPYDTRDATGLTWVASQ